MVRKRLRLVDYILCSSVYFRGFKSDIENDDDEYLFFKKRFRVKLNFVGVGDCLVNEVCFCF